MTDAERLSEIENELTGYVKTDKRNWVKIYQLMHAVEKEKLYLARELPSFTAWVNTLAEEMHVHVSLLWARLKAGRNYAEYEERAARAGRTVTPLDEISISPDTLNLAARVAGKNADEMDSLIDKVVEGSLTRADLRAAAQIQRASGDVGAKTRHDRLSAREKESGLTTRVTAGDIIIALRRNHDWIPIVRADKHFDHIYHVFQEFRANSGTSSHTRLMDALIVETRSETTRDTVTLRGVEIKVSKSDLENDTKMQEYTDFVDYFYIAIPADQPDLLEAAHAIKLQAWGILLIDLEGNITVETDAQRLDAVFRDKTLANCIIKLL